MVMLSFAFADAWTVTSAMAAHLPRIVEGFGATPPQAVFAGMMIGSVRGGMRRTDNPSRSRRFLQNAILLKRIKVIWVVQSQIKKYSVSRPTQIGRISRAVPPL
jgi:hypothetical protein